MDTLIFFIYKVLTPPQNWGHVSILHTIDISRIGNTGFPPFVGNDMIYSKPFVSS